MAAEATGFAGALTPLERTALEASGRRRRYRRGATLFNEGDPADRVVFLVSGRVKISSFTEDGSEIVLALREPGDLLGELSAIDGEPRSATATAIEPCTATVVPSAAFRSFLEEHPRVAVKLLQLVTRRLRDADRKRVEFGAQDVVGRVARRLLELADRFGERRGSTFELAMPISQDELAGWIGASRKAVTNALRTMRARGWIETRRRGLTIADPEALRARAE